MLSTGRSIGGLGEKSSVYRFLLSEFAGLATVSALAGVVWEYLKIDFGYPGIDFGYPGFDFGYPGFDFEDLGIDSRNPGIDRGHPGVDWR
jgi:hypothetical protein